MSAPALDRGTDTPLARTCRTRLPVLRSTVVNTAISGGDCVRVGARSLLRNVYLTMCEIRTIGVTDWLRDRYNDV